MAKARATSDQRDQRLREGRRLRHQLQRPHAALRRLPLLRLLHLQQLGHNQGPDSSVSGQGLQRLGPELPAGGHRDGSPPQPGLQHELHDVIGDVGGVTVRHGLDVVTRTSFLQQRVRRGRRRHVRGRRGQRQLRQHGQLRQQQLAQVEAFADR